MTVVTAHQSNFLLGSSVVSKIEASDAVIWLDEVQFTKGGWTNRQKMPNGSWLTIPVEKHCAFKPINRVRLGEPSGEWRQSVAARLAETWPGEITERVCAEILRPYRLLVGMNVSVLRVILDALGSRCAWYFQSHLDGGHAVQAVSESPADLAPISERLAMMVAEVGGTVYLSGPSGRNYLDERPFLERDVAVEYWSHSGPNPCALELVLA